MNHKFYGILGMLAPIAFVIAYAILSSMHPEYSMYTKAISELGSVDAPNKWLWNVFGYIFTGTLIAIYALGLYKNVIETKSSKLPFYGILLSGIFMIISGVFPGDCQHRTSTTMLLHTVGSFGSYLFFLLGAFSYSEPMKKTAYWKSACKPTLMFTYLTIIFGTWPFVFTGSPAFGQRIVFLFYFAWIFYTGFKVYHKPAKSSAIEHFSG
ncbi:DUF998 domain-containing protein [Spongiimicrobium salis]|uniref:DUF998 domain-containing protein n=1 Tax=Spongiimicrobium salis TaxID=1667022 RepID=UPI00374CD1F1